MAIDPDNIEIIEEFVAESADSIGEVEAILIEMESGVCEADDDTLNLLFRAFHSVKGTAGFLELENIVHVTHLAESLLDKLRRGEMALQPEHVTAFLRGLDCVNRALEEVGTEGTDLCIADLSKDVGTDLEAAMQRAGKQAASEEGADLSQLDMSTPLSDDFDGAEVYSSRDDVAADVAPDSEPEEDDDLLSEFVADSLELLDAVDASMAEARGGVVSKSTTAEALRGLHTIKGNCGFLGYFDLGDLCHATETGLGNLLDGTLRDLDPVFAAVDALREGVRGLLVGAGGGVANLTQLREALEAVSGVAPLTSAHAEASRDDRDVASADIAPVGQDGPADLSEIGPEAFAPEVVPTPANAMSGQDAKSAKNGENKVAARQSIRVDTTKLDELMNLVGELIIAENMVTQNEDLEGHEFESFHKAALHLNRITRSLQDLTMSVRMIPIRPTFRKMLRVARDVARKQSKDVELVLAGEETEVDRSVVEAIGDPLVHLLRNAVDHGVEDVETRLALNKPAKGQIRLSARHEAGEVWIVLSDDGKGLDRDTILNKAIEKGLVDSGDGMTDNDVFQLITEPGFSTAEQLSDISGRGVGMDVVKRNIEKVRGRLEISSVLGEGTTFTLRIPLTLAIVEGMQVRVGEHSYTIPLFAIRESVSVEEKDVTSLTNGDEVLELRNEFIPVLRMSTLHAIESNADTWDEGVLVIVADAGVTMALFVDEVVGQRQTVVKPLPGYLGSLQGLAGCSILSTGKISLVVDVQTLTERIRLAA